VQAASSRLEFGGCGGLQDGRANTERLLDRSLDLIQNALRFFNLPLTGALRRTVIEMIGFMDQALDTDRAEKQ